MSGPKLVQARVLTDRDIGIQYRALIEEHASVSGEKVDPAAYMAEHLRGSPLGPTLFVFDNFETVRSPIDLFQWIDTNIRHPNKIIITTRFRDFKADYPVEISGMEIEEANSLLIQTANSFGVSEILSAKDREEIIDESDRHPYVIKMILGHIADTRKFIKPSLLIARKEEILEALFERTYAQLSPMAVRMFLMLSAWRSLVPQLAAEAVLLRHVNETGDPAGAVDQLVRMSLIERVVAADGADFLEVPLAAALFARKKLTVSPVRPLIEADVKFLQDIGATASTGLKEGIGPRIESFFRKIARGISDRLVSLEEYRPVLEFFARGYAPAWLLLAKLENEFSSNGRREQSANYVRRYLESPPPLNKAKEAWHELYHMYRADGDVIAACGAFLNAAEFVDPPLDEVSAMANWLNTAPELRNDMDPTERLALFGPVAKLMEKRIAEASATDLSRLSWLYLHSGDTTRALHVAELGLERESSNVHCQRLVIKLTNGS